MSHRKILFVERKYVCTNVDISLCEKLTFHYSVPYILFITQLFLVHDVCGYPNYSIFESPPDVIDDDYEEEKDLAGTYSAHMCLHPSVTTAGYRQDRLLCMFELICPLSSSNPTETVNDHKSIILHVLSQLRPGVDLTRVSVVLQRLCFLNIAHTHTHTHNY